jgi:hypothetical protein
MIPRVGQNCDRCLPEVIMCGRTLAGRALRRAPMVSSRREQSPSLRSPSGRPIRIGSGGPGALRYGSSLVVFIRVPSGRSETVVAAGLRS